MKLHKNYRLRKNHVKFVNIGGGDKEELNEIFSDEKNIVSANNIFREVESLDIDKIYKYLKKAESKYKKYVMNMPPVKPTTNQLFLYNLLKNIIKFKLLISIYGIQQNIL